MHTLRFHSIIRRGSVSLILFAIAVLFTSLAPGQPRYRTFSQAEFALKKLKAVAEKWWWDTSGTQIGPVYKDLAAASAEGFSRQPNGGNVRDFMYKHEIRRPNGLLVGMPTSTPNVGWIRYMTADRKYFPHTDSSRCFDFIARDNGGTRPFVG